MCLFVNTPNKIVNINQSCSAVWVIFLPCNCWKNKKTKQCLNEQFIWCHWNAKVRAKGKISDINGTSCMCCWLKCDRKLPARIRLQRKWRLMIELSVKHYMSDQTLGSLFELELREHLRRLLSLSLLRSKTLKDALRLWWRTGRGE